MASSRFPGKDVCNRVLNSTSNILNNRTAQAGLRIGFPIKHGTALDQENEEFTRNQLTALIKTIGAASTETGGGGIKEKHVRTLIIGTFREHGASLFWKLVLDNITLHGNEISSWKFCYVVHRLILDGHRGVVASSAKHLVVLEKLLLTWEHYDTGYGPLIFDYVNLLVFKVSFHTRNNHLVPGSLVFGDLCLIERHLDVAVAFEFSTDCFDYVEHILKLAEAICTTFDNAKRSSLTPAGQCRLTPLLPCVQDTTKLIELCIAICRRLHSQLPFDCLQGHRQRFEQLYIRTKKFLDKIATLQFFKGIINIPALPKDPPQFFRVSEEDSEGRFVNGKMSNAFSSTSNPADICEVEPEQDQQLQSTMQQLMESNETIESLQSTINHLQTECQNMFERLSMESDMHVAEKSQLEADLSSQYLKNEKLSQELESLKLERNEILRPVTPSSLTPQDAFEGEKFEKLKDVYQKLRNDHISLLREHGKLQKDLFQYKQLTSLLENEKLICQNSLADIAEHLAKLKIITLSTMNNQASSYDDLVAALGRLEKYNNQNDLMGILVKNVVKDIKNIEHLITLDNVGIVREGCASALSTLNRCNDKSCKNILDIVNIGSVVQCLGIISLAIQVLSSSSSSSNYDTCSRELNNVFSSLQSFLLSLNDLEVVKNSLAIVAQSCGSDPDATVNGSDAIAIEIEISKMESSIDMAAAKMEQLMREARRAKDDHGIEDFNLDVNIRILDPCKELVNAVKMLIAKAKILQAEIVGETSDIKVQQFYKRNHKWTEGLISAAKSVGSAANLLVYSADEIFINENETMRFETLMAASQEVAASSAQMVMASKVRAPLHSQNVEPLTTASKEVSQTTAKIIAVCRDISHERAEIAEKFDFNSLTQHQTKLLEMESQVRVLELESQLDQERQRLFKLRRFHYRNEEEEEKSTS